MTDDSRSLFRDELRSARPYVVGGTGASRAKLNQNESPFDLPDGLKQRLAERLQSIPFNRYPAEQPGELAVAAAEYAGVHPSSVLVSHGSNEFVHSLCLAFVDPRSQVVLPTPMFALFSNVVNLFGGHVREVPCRSNLTYDVAAVCDAVADARLAILACPNNPTGKDLSFDAIRSILDAANGMTVIDEAYWEFTDRRSAVALLEDYPRLIVMRTLSKAFGIAAMRIGYAVARPDVIDQLMKVRLPFMVDPFAEQVGVAVLAERSTLLDRVNTIKASKRSLQDALGRIEGVDVVSSETNFVLFRTPHDADTIRTGLESRGVAARSMSGYHELKRYLRVNAGTEGENRIFVDALKSALDAL